MNDKSLQEQETKQKELENSDNIVSPRNNRRKLLKSALAIPVVMTLNTNVAAQVARSSNLIGALIGDTNDGFLDANAASTLDTSNNKHLVCLQPDPMKDQSMAPPYDLGDAPMRTPLLSSDESGNAIKLSDQATECINNNGIIVSTTAFTSLTDKFTNL